MMIFQSSNEVPESDIFEGKTDKFLCLRHFFHDLAGILRLFRAKDEGVFSKTKDFRLHP